MPEGPAGGPRPFAKSEVLIVLDFTDTPEATQWSKEKSLKSLKSTLKSLVDGKMSNHFNGEVDDVRVDFISGGDGDKGVRVVYNTGVKTVSKSNLNKVEDEFTGATGTRANYAEMTVVAE